MNRPVVAPTVALLLLASAACAAPRPIAPDAPPPVAASTAPCEPYGDEAPSPRTPLEQRGWEELQRAYRARGATVHPSGALDRAARALAERATDAGGAPLARERVQAALRGAGAFDPSPRAHLASGPPDEALAAVLTRAEGSDVSHAGIGAYEDAAGSRIVLLLSRRRARLDRFPGSVAVGESARLRGELLGLLHPRAYVTRPDGSSTEVDLFGGRGFSTTLAFPFPGRYEVEVVGTGDRATEVAALLTVSAGGAPCAAASEGPAVPAPTDSDPVAAEAAVAGAASRLRVARGLPPLEPSRELGAVARAHSERMRATRTVAHVLPGSGELADRLSAARIPFLRAWENVASASTPLDAHAATEASPAHLANLLAPRATRIGVGVAFGALATGEPAVYLTEILVEPAEEPSEDRRPPDARVRDVLWRERARRALPPLTNDLALEAIARSAATSMRARDSGRVEGVVEAALRGGRELAAVDAFIARAPNEVLRSRNLTDARFLRVGVGVAVGDSRRYGPARLFIAVVYGR